MTFDFSFASPSRQRAARPGAALRPLCVDDARSRPDASCHRDTTRPNASPGIAGAANDDGSTGNAACSHGSSSDDTSDHHADACHDDFTGHDADDTDSGDTDAGSRSLD